VHESVALPRLDPAIAANSRAADVGVLDAAPCLPEGFEPLRIKRVIRETAQAISIVLDVPESSAQRFCYQAGQFLTLLVRVDGCEHRRCYSMSSSPLIGEDLRITVKRDRDGVVSNWLNDTAAPGDELYVAPPQGRFVLKNTDRELIAFAGGSGITPVFSLLRSALASTTRGVRLFYANRVRDSVIFAEQLAALRDRYPDRFTLHHHLDEESGIVTPTQIDSFVACTEDADFYICGPGPFMSTVEATLMAAGVPPARVSLERFEVAATPAPAPGDVGSVITEEVTVELGKRTVSVPYSPGDTLLQTARMAGLQPPSSCETGSCGTCMARLTVGSARMVNNDALDDDEVNDGWVLTCQALPTSRKVRVVYE
jgi:3-ketosteroid 9alpha-monooxygenase subunit B